MRQSLFKDAFHETEFLTTEKTVILILNDSPYVVNSIYPEILRFLTDT
jgi:hypothetical protein